MCRLQARMILWPSKLTGSVESVTQSMYGLIRLLLMPANSVCNACIDLQQPMISCCEVQKSATPAHYGNAKVYPEEELPCCIRWAVPLGGAAESRS